MNSPLMIFITHSMIISGMVYWCLLMFVDVYWCLLMFIGFTGLYPIPSQVFFAFLINYCIKMIKDMPFTVYTTIFGQPQRYPWDDVGKMCKTSQLCEFEQLVIFSTTYIFFIGMLRVRQEGGPPKLESASVSTWSVQSIRVRKEILPDAHCPVWAVLITMVNISKKSWYWIATGHGWL